MFLLVCFNNAEQINFFKKIFIVHLSFSSTFLYFILKTSLFNHAGQFAALPREVCFHYSFCIFTILSIKFESLKKQ